MKCAVSCWCLAVLLFVLPAWGRDDRPGERTRVDVWIGIDPWVWQQRGVSADPQSPDYVMPPDVEYIPQGRRDVRPVQSCYAGGYVCRLNAPQPAGTSCSCPVQGATRAFGRAAD